MLVFALFYFLTVSSKTDFSEDRMVLNAGP
jgi:hypothetical protein